MFIFIFMFIYWFIYVFIYIYIILYYIILHYIILYYIIYVCMCICICRILSHWWPQFVLSFAWFRFRWPARTPDRARRRRWIDGWAHAIPPGVYDIRSLSRPWPSPDEGFGGRDRWNLLGLHGGTPIRGLFIMENPHLKWMIWGYPYFRKPPHVKSYWKCWSERCIPSVGLGGFPSREIQAGIVEIPIELVMKLGDGTLW